MKVNLTLEIGDGLRRAIAKDVPQAKTTRNGRATRQVIIQYLQAQAMQASADWSKLFPRPDLPPIEAKEHGLAVDYLRKLGRSDQQIREWLLIERARLHFPNVDITQTI